jgi:hypothetical protein
MAHQSRNPEGSGGRTNVAEGSDTEKVVAEKIRAKKTRLEKMRVKKVNDKSTRQGAHRPYSQASERGNGGAAEKRAGGLRW